jgi:hypothetical protein
MVNLFTLHTAGSSFVEVNQLLSATISVTGGVKLEWPQEVRGGLEVRTDGEDLVNQILNTHNVKLAEGSADHGVGGKGHTLGRHLTVSTLVDKLSHGLEVGVSVGNVWLDQIHHLGGSSVHADEDTIVDLTKTKELQDLLDLGGHSNSTTHSHNKHKLALIGDKKLTSGLSLASVINIGLCKL